MHGGAGVIDDPAACAAGLIPAVEEAYRLLKQSASSLEAVITAVQILEDSGSFNAGTGADLTIDGVKEMDAAVMTQEGRFGGVCCITGIKNPVLAAQKVMLESDHVLLCGEGAREFARKMGLVESDVVTMRARARLKRVVEDGSVYFPRMNRARFGEAHEVVQQVASSTGTVGAVAVDKHGSLAAATSTGGIAGRLRGRVGDSAIIGAGTYASPGGAVSCTGHGEEIMRRMLARDIVDRMTTMPGSVAMTLALSEARRRKMVCGAVGFDAHGAICYGHTSPDMAYAYKVADRLFLFTEEKRPRRDPSAAHSVPCRLESAPVPCPVQLHEATSSLTHRV